MELADWVASLSESQSEVINRALHALRDGPGGDVAALAAALARIEVLETQVRIYKNAGGDPKALEALPLHPDAVTAESRARAVSLVRQTQEPINPKAHHPAGPVMKSAMPSRLEGEAWSVPKSAAKSKGKKYEPT